MYTILLRYITFIALLVVTLACSTEEAGTEGHIILKHEAYPAVAEHEGRFYLVTQTEELDTARIHYATDINGFGNDTTGAAIFTLTDKGLHNMYSPELHRLDGKWYMYFEADTNGNTDYHQLYAFENASDDPRQGQWTPHGPIITTDEWNWAIHPTVFERDGELYMLWSGWEKRRIEAETQCIFIARMANPWTLDSKRVKLSEPIYEWERQWIDPDGARSAYPIYVNENPQVMISPDNRNIVVCYSASGIWTVYSTVGMLYAPYGSDLLNPRSWTKLSEPQFLTADGAQYFGASNISYIRDPKDNRDWLFYQMKYYDNNWMRKVVALKEIKWNEKGLPEFGKP